MNSTVYIYFKEGEMKTLDIGHGQADHAKMVNDGWVLTATVNAGLFIEEMFKHAPNSMISIIESLSSKTPLSQ